MPPISLSDAELDAVMAAATPLAPALRDEFLRAVARELSTHGEIGPGLVYRAIKVVQRQYFDAPDLGRGPGSRWSR